jgi:hypothetical protein
MSKLITSEPTISPAVVGGRIDRSNDQTSSETTSAATSTASTSASAAAPSAFRYAILPNDIQSHWSLHVVDHLQSAKGQDGCKMFCSFNDTLLLCEADFIKLRQSIDGVKPYNIRMDRSTLLQAMHAKLPPFLAKLAGTEMLYYDQYSMTENMAHYVSERTKAGLTTDTGYLFGLVRPGYQKVMWWVSVDGFYNANRGYINISYDIRRSVLASTQDECVFTCFDATDASGRFGVPVDAPIIELKPMYSESWKLNIHAYVNRDLHPQTDEEIANTTWKNHFLRRFWPSFSNKNFRSTRRLQFIFNSQSLVAA